MLQSWSELVLHGGKLGLQLLKKRIYIVLSALKLISILVIDSVLELRCSLLVNHLFLALHNLVSVT